MKINNLLVYILVLIIVISSFTIPNILLKFKKYDFEMSVEKEGSISAEVEDIYLVKLIHSIEESKQISLSSNIKSGEVIEFAHTYGNEEINSFEKQIIELQDCGILKQKEIRAGKVISVNKIYSGDDTEYVISNVTLNLDGKNYEMGAEQKTGKILSLSFDKEELNTEISEEDILRNYIEYLNLHVIDDWTYEDNVLKSEKAKLVVILLKNGDKRLLCINTLNKFKEYLDMTEYIDTTSIQEKYNFDTNLYYY